MPAPQEVVRLVNRFTDQRDVYRSGKYNETQLRRDFLDPLFEALGWDVSNRKDLSEANRDVINEMSVEMEGHAKAADYAFKTNNKIFFFLEAKKPSVNIETNPAPAFQLRSYGWTAKLPFSVLSDFEQMAVYDCRIKPVFGDTPLIARHKLYSYSDYVEQWDEISDLLSYDAVHQGALDKLGESVRNKRGTADVDDDFLVTMEHWREELARVISLRNVSLSQRQINTAVQLIIDRIIFLRICEDRGIEPENGLKDATDGVDVYGDLMELFKKADQKYNSGLFHFNTEKGQASHPDTLTPTLKIDDKVLKDILANLYPPKSPYAFKYFSADILGQVYERFLGKVITLSDGHRSKVIEKPEVRKAGGVYYTPTYIVDYIVKNTVGELLKDKTPADMLVEPIRVLDPACGSGSFLLGAYQYLLDWYLDWYSTHDPQKWSKGKNPPIFDNGGWQLTMEKKKEILTSHLFGVDIDAQAVEVTKLSLLLKVVENPGQLSLLGERILPDLGENIQCGNSLIGPDYYENQQMSMFDSEEQYRVNAFDWQSAFPKAFAVGGFDAVIGNPPYIFTREQIAQSELLYYSSHFNLSWEKKNTYMLFMELMLKLVNSKGYGSFIVPNSWLTIESAKKLRKEYFSKLSLVVDLNFMVFERVSVEPCIFVISKDNNEDVYAFRAKSKSEFDLQEKKIINREQWKNIGNKIIFSNSTNSSSLIEKIITNSLTIGDFFDVRTGLQAYEKGKGTPPQSAKDVKEHIFDRKNWVDKNSYKYLQGKDVGRYGLNWSGMWMQYGPWLSQPREIGLFSRPRLLLREITSEYPHCLFATYVDAEFLNNKSILNVLHDENNKNQVILLVGVLNSKLMSFYYKQCAVKSERKIFPKVVINNLREFPFPSKIDSSLLSKIVNLVDTILLLNTKTAGTQLPDEKERLQRQIAITDQQIDKLVYELYGLTEEEIRIVEGG